MSLLLSPYRICGEERGSFCVLDAQGATLRAEVRGHMRESDSWPAIGDWVTGQHQAGDWVSIEEVLPRRNALQRKNTMGRIQTFASNIDYMFVVTSANQDLKLSRLDRFVSMAYGCSIQPVIIVNKIELSIDSKSILESLASRFQGVHVHGVSVYEGFNLDIFSGYLSMKQTAVFVGSSGVGKSSLVNWMTGHDAIKTQEVRSSDDRGRHTTTTRSLYVLENGASIIDTPGIRTLALVDSEGAHELFSDIDLLARMCKFRDCRHQGEPGCAIEQARHDGNLDESRLKSYQKLEQESELSYRRAKKHLYRDERRREVRAMREYKKIKSERARR